MTTDSAAIDRLRLVDSKQSPIRNAISVLSEPSWSQVIRTPLSDGASALLASLASGKKLTRLVMDKDKDAVTELVTKGCIKLDIKKRDRKTGITPGKIMPHAVIALAAEMLDRIEEWRLQQ